MILNKVKYLLLPLTTTIVIIMALQSCGVYSFTDASVDPNIKTIRIDNFSNNASYVNPQLAPNLNDRLKQKIISQTKLSNTNSDEANLVVTGYVAEYYPSTSGISNKQENMNRLTVTVHIDVTNNLNNEKKAFDVTRNFEFPATTSLQAAETRLMDEMVKSLADDLFARMFSSW